MALKKFQVEDGITVGNVIIDGANNTISFGDSTISSLNGIITLTSSNGASLSINGNSNVTLTEVSGVSSGLTKTVLLRDGSSSNITYNNEVNTVLLRDGSTSNLTISDIRVKDNIRATEQKSLELVRSIEVIDFEFKSNTKFFDNKTHTSFRAQDFQNKVNDVVYDIENDLLAINKSELVPTLWKALQDALVMIDDLTARVNNLEEKATKKRVKK